ncbi:hypothetical protein GDO81_006344 [Engystomops pustulosus]|uniref:Hematopoietic progenitor cell antigen CD34 n=1 Tax=Engystomops pustulosus TaxID=76066 RepID=A0AAV7CXS4_ENGPU|nr:hypothetical protein GDO81_006344 [Engystomops pustulosus]
MLSCNLTPWTRGQILLAVLSLLTVLDASTVTPTGTSKMTTANVAVTTQRLATSHPATLKTSSDKPSHVTSLVPTQSTVHSLIGTTPRTLIQTKEAITVNTTETQIPQETFTTLTPAVTDVRHSASEYSTNTTTLKGDPTTEALPSTKSGIMLQTTRLAMDVLSTQPNIVPGSITCQSLGTFTSTSKVVCFQLEEEKTCETLDKEKKEELRYFLCKIMESTECNITLHSSEIQPKCILWVPTSKDAEQRLHNETALSDALVTYEMQWAQISDHQTKSQKTMIALVTCGVLLAAFILAGYFLSNRESWSPGRQRLGEDPYCTETDSQGNTLVSVSAHAQDKPNNATRENGTGQTVTPSATNGHSTKKQNVSDTEL